MGLGGQRLVSGLVQVNRAGIEQHIKRAEMGNWKDSLGVLPQGMDGFYQREYRGLIPWFGKDGKPVGFAVKARVEGIQTNASYREPVKKRLWAMRRTIWQS